MRILCLTARLPYPPNRGDRLRAYNFIKSLSRQHEIHLLSFISDEKERVNIEPLISLCQDVQVVPLSKLQSILSVAMNIGKPLPLQALYYRSRLMQELVDKKLSQLPFDLIYVHLFRMAPFVGNVRRIYRIVDLTDVISREITRSLVYRGLASRLLYTFERPRIQRYEYDITSKFEEVWLISEADKQELAKACPAANIQVIRNGVDTHLFYPLEHQAQDNILMFSGHMGVAHNIDAATLLVERIFPLIKQRVPDTKTVIVGAEPAPAVQKLAKIPGVTVTGYVPDLNTYLNRAAVFCAPLRFAAGVQNKVLEALAAARPVVTTSIVNEGLGTKPGKEIIIADSPEQIAHAVINLLENRDLADQIGQAGQAFVLRYYSWDLVLKRVQVIENRPSPIL